MKTSNLLPLLAAGTLAAAAAHAQVELTITGSSAFRSITIDRVESIYDTNSMLKTVFSASAGTQSYDGTMSNNIPSLRSTPVKIRLSFSGSGSGMLAVKNQTPIATAETPSNTVSRIPDLALSDVFPASATPPLADSAFERSILGVVPFVLIRNNDMTGVTGITRDQAYLLMTASGTIGGIPGMPASFLGGSSSRPVYFIGRDPGSGTRITVHKVIGFNGTPTLWATNAAGAFVLTNGFSSGSQLRSVVGGKSDAIGYLGLADSAAIASTATPIAYNGVAYSPANVANGSYALWGYEHIVNRAGGLSANQKAVRDALISAITNPSFQATNQLYNLNFVSLSNMQVERGTDGGPITSLLW